MRYFVLSSGLLCSAVLAQDVSTLNPLVVTATRFPVVWENAPTGVTVLDGERLRQQGYTSVESALAGSGALYSASTGGEVQFGMRGVAPGSSNLLVMVDGQKINQNDTSAIHLSGLSLQNVERIEIIRSSGGVIYGDQAVAGAINIITTSPGTISLSAWMREDGQLSGSVQVPLQIASDVDVSVGAEYDQYTGFRDNSGRENLMAFSELAWKSNAATLRWRSEYTDSTVRYAGALSLAQVNDDPSQATTPDEWQQNKTWSHRLNTTWSNNAALSTELDVFYRDNQYEAFIFSSDSEFSRQTLGVNPRVRWQPSAFSFVNATFGADLIRADLEYSFNDRTMKQWQYAGYIDTNVSVTPSITVSGGARYALTDEELTDSAMYPNGESLSQEAVALALGAEWQRGEFLASVDWAQNFRFAKVDEQAYTDVSVLGLKPQTGQSIEAALAWRTAYRDLEIQVFHLTLEDEIFFDSTANGPGSFSGANVNGAASTRIGAHAHWQEEWTHALWTRLSADYVRATFSEGANDGKTIPGVPEWFAAAQFGVRPISGLSLVTDVRYRGEQFLSGDNANASAPLDGYALVDASVNYQLPVAADLSVMARVNNVLDQAYFLSAASWGAYFPGDGRNGLIRLDYRF